MTQDEAIREAREWIHGPMWWLLQVDGKSRQLIRRDLPGYTRMWAGIIATVAADRERREAKQQVDNVPIHTVHNFDKVMQRCVCGWQNNPLLIKHWEQQWAEHLQLVREAKGAE